MHIKDFSRGFTILEAIVSILITGFVLVGMLQLYSLGAIQSNIARHKLMAANIAQAEIESIINTSYEGINLSSYPMTKTVTIDTGKTDNANDNINAIMVTDISSVSEGYKIIVTVSWNDYYSAMSEVMASTMASYL